MEFGMRFAILYHLDNITIMVSTSANSLLKKGPSNSVTLLSAANISQVAVHSRVVDVEFPLLHEFHNGEICNNAGPDV
eukprot:5713054-Amphidinium_carterae.1